MLKNHLKIDLKIKKSVKKTLKNHLKTLKNQLKNTKIKHLIIKISAIYKENQFKSVVFDMIFINFNDFLLYKG